MANYYLADSLVIGGLKNYALVPTSDNAATAAMLLDILNREARTFLTSFLLDRNEGYLLETASIALVAGTTRYRIPSAAAGAALHSVQAVDASGANPVELFATTPDNENDTKRFRGRGTFYVEGNYLVLLDDPGSGAGSLKLRYPRRINRVVASTECAEITSFNLGAKTATWTVAPSSAPSGARYDIVRGTPHFDVMLSADIGTVAGSTMTFASALPTDLAASATANADAGDWIAKAGTTPILNFPVEIQDLLVAQTVYVYLLARGDPKTQAAREFVEAKKREITPMIQPRVSADDAPLINFYRAGWRAGVRWRPR
jgi:hypothetical protein